MGESWIDDVLNKNKNTDSLFAESRCEMYEMFERWYNDGMDKEEMKAICFFAVEAYPIIGLWIDRFFEGKHGKNP
jgi:hypothetical protein